MSLRPPTDYSKSVIAIVVGISAALVIHSLRRSEHPHSGDNIHHLPYGGNYRDGTKSVNYFNKQGGKEPGGYSIFWVICAIWIIIALLHVFRTTTVRRISIHSCHSCGCSH
ncbi:TGB2 [Garlic common virus]|nr:TGB2 [Garlic common virus]QED43076.1 TGB2 [Garlic common virus]QED43081.1 TGB2 [Garlic common virus]QED43086.1 TGB2 [Garlic common virus]